MKRWIIIILGTFFGAYGLFMYSNIITNGTPNESNVTSDVTSFLSPSIIYSDYEGFIIHDNITHVIMFYDYDGNLGKSYALSSNSKKEMYYEHGVLYVYAYRGDDYYLVHEDGVIEFTDYYFDLDKVSNLQCIDYNNIEYCLSGSLLRGTILEATSSNESIALEDMNSNIEWVGYSGFISIIPPIIYLIVTKLKKRKKYGIV